MYVCILLTSVEIYEEHSPYNFDVLRVNFHILIIIIRHMLRKDS